MAMAGLLHELRLDSYELIAGLLHDTVEDTEVSCADLRENFVVIVNHLVDGVTEIEALEEFSDE
jgi:guanosine-3',5'-bis(diphosphate) 3'-pyrophosphohydrolase